MLYLNKTFQFRYNQKYYIVNYNTCKTLNEIKVVNHFKFI